eukprot:TRINITY_DN48477_c0_g1_i1.p1 TRINITY_DN48477_c0_g1~~TRINITY_DN48477_c0_g1_i1.p1  ORF type:complete len:270 (+),score=59.44 TRINITY_DN48477_c0_g1_i1:53-811(+)
MAEGGVPIEVECGGVSVRVMRKDLEEDDGQDPCFFDEDYSVAAATGFTIWEGGKVLINMLQGDLGERVCGHRVLELGAGIGLAGLCAAAAGAHVLITDLPAVVHGAIASNIDRNAAGPAPDGAWAGSVAIGVKGGSASSAVLDWSRPLSDQCEEGKDPRDAQIIVASEVVWLEELVGPFVEVASALLAGPARPELVLVARERATASSESFTRVSVAVEALRKRGCAVRCLRTVPSEEDAGQETIVWSATAAT